MIDNIINMIYNCFQYQIYDITKENCMKFTPKQQKAVDDADKIYSKLNLKDRTYIEEQYDKKFDYSSLALKESMNALYGDKKKKNISILFIILSAVFYFVARVFAESVSSVITFVSIAVVFFVIVLIISIVRKSTYKKFGAYLFSLFIIRITGGEIDKYFDEPELKANLNKMTLFKIEENAMIKIPETEIKE